MPDPTKPRTAEQLADDIITAATDSKVDPDGRIRINGNRAYASVDRLELPDGAREEVRRLVHTRLLKVGDVAFGVRLCVRCGEMGTIGEVYRGIWACEKCMDEVDEVLPTGSWMPPAYLLAVLTRRTPKFWEKYLSMQRRTAILRAAMLAADLLGLADELVGSGLGPEEHEEYIAEINRAYAQWNGVEENFAQPWRMLVIELVEYSARAHPTARSDAKLVAQSLEIAHCLYPEHKVDRKLFERAVQAWQNPEGKVKQWDAIKDLLPGWKNRKGQQVESVNIATMWREWKRERKVKHWDGARSLPNLLAPMANRGVARSLLALHGTQRRVEASNERFMKAYYGDEKAAASAALPQPRPEERSVDQGQQIDDNEAEAADNGEGRPKPDDLH